ncbi:hypothetical protein SISSUDRAFT_1034640 [Sistotremastrum suecicum HHB10207 ss-3]|uniref:RlpA-like protein double-psi beta-barrel domain-containing protein n=1 Tax=Sistotremastrum suecicum HHB10207 ss-3 TaxID=1314776 RepID=A0A166BU39_9AGAM|nr:hypothetical protein SISSUDRAFT_1034640 [Sistotremastrum suecicum HHB10207 ss-3]
MQLSFSFFAVLSLSGLVASIPTPQGAPPIDITATQTGQGTFYTPGLGACGVTNTEADLIVAISQSLFQNFPGFNGGNPNANPVCGKSITANFQGKSVTVTVTDACVGCAATDLDFSPAAFDELADPSVGRISGMTWSFNN